VGDLGIQHESPKGNQDVSEVMTRVEDGTAGGGGVAQAVTQKLGS